MKITIEMDSIHELWGFMERRRRETICDHKKDPIWASELYETYTIAKHGKHIRFKEHLSPSDDEFAVLYFDELSSETQQFWYDMAKLLKEMKK